ncbi:PAS domain S-box protein [Nostoc sp. WHI]|nr:PAS domain S-box protein [Nostoc sp. WHI]
MNRLRYPQKFLLISIVFSMPTILMMYLLITEIGSRIDFAKQEIIGNLYLQSATRLWEHTLRGQISSEVGNNNYDFTQLNQALETIENKDRQFGNKLHSTENFTLIKEYFKTLSTKNNNQNSFIYSQIINSTEKLRLHVGDTSNLILDPDLDSYYMMDSSLLKLPTMQKILAEIQSLTMIINKRKKINPEERRKLIELSALLKEESHSLSRNMNIGFKNNPLGNLQPKLSKFLEEYIQNIKQQTNQLDQLNQTNQEVFPNPSLAQNNLDSSLLLSDRVMTELDLILKQRINQLTQKQQFVCVFVLLTLSIVTYLFIGFYLAVMQTVYNLTLAAKRMTNGKSGTLEMLALENRDELSQVVESFNKIAIALVEAINSSREAETKYRSIFENSIEGIFQTTPDGKFISVNPALAKMYGYDSPQELINAFTNNERQLYVNDRRCDELTRYKNLHGQVIGFESEVYRQDGSTIWILENSHSVYNQAGELIYYEGSVQDISYRKATEMELQASQLQLIQNEKMSALGNLVAGIAHEMNNPLGFIAASLKQAKPIIADIVEHLKLYQESLPSASDEIKNHAEEIDLDYSLEDLPKMVDSMTMACDRLKNISTSLRTFSRADQDYKVPFDIHQGIDSTILILKHRLKANKQRPDIEVITEYSSLPQIECFPGQLNQVFMNILANAIDALDESNANRSFEEIQINPNRITIKTSVENEGVKITITDNGKGMTEEIKQKIFDHLFTTKAVGNGTGLGLAIARQIIVEKHGGAIAVDSTLAQGTEFTIQLPIHQIA